MPIVNNEGVIIIGMLRIDVSLFLTKTLPPPPRSKAATFGVATVNVANVTKLTVTTLGY